MPKRQREDQDGEENEELTSPHEHVKNTYMWDDSQSPGAPGWARRALTQAEPRTHPRRLRAAGHQDSCGRPLRWPGWPLQPAPCKPPPGAWPAGVTAGGTHDQGLHGVTAGGMYDQGPRGGHSRGTYNQGLCGGYRQGGHMIRGYAVVTDREDI